MTDRPILFSGPMVRALLDGRKTQTRRVLKPQPATFETAQGTECLVYPFRVEGDDHWRIAMGSSDRSGVLTAQKMPYGPGDRLWVREAFSYESLDVYRNGFMPPWYWADGNPSSGDFTKPKPSIHMPRWASRLTLIVSEVRVQRLQEISEADAIAEGIRQIATIGGTGWQDFAGGVGFGDPRLSYRSLWENLNGARGFGWQANPWVVAVSFTVEHRNIVETSK